MSWWDTYLAPGDVRARQQLEQKPQQPQPNPRSQDGSLNSASARIDPAHRLRRQNAIFFGGIAFTCLSLFITRRTLIRKRISTGPKTFTPSNPQHPPEIGIPEGSKSGSTSRGDGALDALQALNLATLNVFSFFMTAVGAGVKYWDIADLEDFREKVRRGIGFDVYGGDSDADKEIEGWVAEILARKDEGVSGLREGVAEAMGKIQERERLVEERKRKMSGGS